MITMKKSSFKLEKELMSQGYDFVIGIDEAGRGPLAGPVVACAAAWRKSQFQNPNIQINSKSQNSKFKKNFSLIKDSKKLSEKQREELHDFICEYFYVGIGVCDHKTIDRINILEATFLSMKKAIGALTRNVERITPDSDVSRFTFHDMRKIILIDGNKTIPNLSVEQKAIVGGDNLVKSISAASIVAKVTRDRMMKKMHEKYPQYCFDKHKGYGTKMHIEAIKKYGICSIHRRSFGPCHK